MIGTQLRIEYFDMNSAFETIFRRSEKIARRFKTELVDNWLLLELDIPFYYKDQNNTHILIRSRWQKHEIGEKEPTSIFVLLIPDNSLLENNLIDIDKFDHVVW